MSVLSHSDVTARDTFEELDKYVEFLKDGANPGCYIILVGTKLDLEEDGNKPRGVTRQQAQEYADKIGALHYETRSHFLSFPFPFFSCFFFFLFSKTNQTI